MDPYQSFASAAIKFPLLSIEEEKELTTQYRKTPTIELRNRLVNHNLRLVMKIVAEAPGAPQNSDLLSEGCIGLVKGVERFEPERGLKLSTYVSYWIKAYVLSFIVKDSRLVKFTTANQRKLFFNLNKEKEKLRAQGVEITAELIASRLSVTEKDVTEMQTRLRETSFDKVLHDDRSLGDYLASDGLTPDEAFASAERECKLKECFDIFKSSLAPAEKVVFELRMLEDKKLQEVGDKLKISRERVRQLEGRIEGKFRRFCENRNIQATV